MIEYRTANTNKNLRRWPPARFSLQYTPQMMGHQAAWNNIRCDPDKTGRPSCCTSRTVITIHAAAYASIPILDMARTRRTVLDTVRVSIPVTSELIASSPPDALIRPRTSRDAVHSNADGVRRHEILL